MAKYSKTPLIKKIGIKEGFTIKLFNQPDYYLKLLNDLPKNVVELKKETKEPVDFIHYFASDLKLFVEILPDLKNQIKSNGMIWISWDKTKSKNDGELSENLIRQRALSLNLVDIKVCAIDETWSGLKSVIRKEFRK